MWVSLLSLFQMWVSLLSLFQMWVSLLSCYVGYGLDMGVAAFRPIRYGCRCFPLSD